MKTKKNKKHTSTFLYLNQYGVALYCKTVQLFPPPPVLPRFPHVFLAFSREVVSKNCLLGIYTLFFGPKADDILSHNTRNIKKTTENTKKNRLISNAEQARIRNSRKYTAKGIYGKGKTTINNYECQAK